MLEDWEEPAMGCWNWRQKGNTYQKKQKGMEGARVLWRGAPPCPKQAQRN